MTLDAGILRERTVPYGLMALTVLATGLILAVWISSVEIEVTSAAAVGAVASAVLLLVYRPGLGVMVSFGLFAEILYFGTFGFTLPSGQLVPSDLIFLSLWGLTLAAAFRQGRNLLVRSPMGWFLGVFYPILLVFYFCYTNLGFGAGPQEMLRAARPFLYLTLFVPLSFWLALPGVLDDLLRLAAATALCAAGLQFFIYLIGIDVEPYGLFYEWQVWRGAFEGFDRSNQPFFGLNLMLAGGLVTLALGERVDLRRWIWSLCAGVIFLSAVISFGRGFWAGMAVASLTAMVLAARSGRGRSLASVVTICAVACVALAALAGAAGVDGTLFLGAAFDRAQAGAESIRYFDGTFGDRYDRINRAVIAEHRWLGVGFFLALGSAGDIDYADTGHNLYMDIMLRLGVLGLTVFAAMFWIFTARCRLALALGLSPFRRAAVVGCLGAGLGNLAWAVSSSHMLSHRGMFEMALMMAIVETIISGEKRSAAAAGGGA